MSFSKRFVTSLNPKLTFELRPLTKSNAAHASSLFARTFCEEALDSYFKLSESDLYNYDAFPLAQINAEENLGVTCYDLDADLMVGVLLHDMPGRLHDRFLNSSNPKVSKAYGFTDVYKTDNKDLFQKFEQAQEGWLHGCNFSVDQRYQKMGLAKYIQYFALFEHPELTKCRYFTFDATSPFSNKIARQFFFQEIWARKWEDIARVPGYGYYDDMMEDIKRRKLPFDDMYRIYMFDRRQYNEQKIKSIAALLK
jgi:hypothetical protein